MSAEEEARLRADSAKLEEIRKELWNRVKYSDPFNSVVAATLVRLFGLYSPEGEDPESA